MYAMLPDAIEACGSAVAAFIKSSPRTRFLWNDSRVKCQCCRLWLCRLLRCDIVGATAVGTELAALHARSRNLRETDCEQTLPPLNYA